MRDTLKEQVFVSVKETTQRIAREIALTTKEKNYSSERWRLKIYDFDDFDNNVLRSGNKRGIIGII